MSNKVTNSTPENLEIVQDGKVLQIYVCGDFVNRNYEEINFTPTTKEVRFFAENLKKWDSSLILLLYETIKIAKQRNICYNISKLPKNLQELIYLAFSVDRNPQKAISEQFGFVETVGIKTVKIFDIIMRFFKYMREIFASISRFFTFKAITRKIDFLSALDGCGPRALGIVSLISFLVGLILAFVGAVQLKTFGAQIYVASLVTIGMCRIMGAIMVGIIMAGRTGSSYAASIGTMQVNEELDALETMGFSKIDFLVLPRLFALMIAMPILVMWADIMGILGGAFIGVVLMNLPYQEYWKYAFDAFSLTNFLVGIFHGFCFGIIIALSGCYNGLTCGRSANSVGVATTKSVVNSIVWMIVVTGIITVICQELGI